MQAKTVINLLIAQLILLIFIFALVAVPVGVVGWYAISEWFAHGGNWQGVFNARYKHEKAAEIIVNNQYSHSNYRIKDGEWIEQ